MMNTRVRDLRPYLKPETPKPLIPIHRLSMLAPTYDPRSTEQLKNDTTISSTTNPCGALILSEIMSG